MKTLIVIFSMIATPLFANRIVQSTSSDWEAVTGMRLGEYTIKFVGTGAVDLAWEMYYLDEFPCYGNAQYVRAWANTKTTDAFVRLICVTKPSKVRLAYRVAKKGDPQGKTTGILTCDVDRNLNLDLSKCTKETWAEFEKNNLRD